jgi:adenylate cyclase
MITYLAKLHALRIISRTSAMHYKSTKKSIPEIAQELNVEAAVEGSVLRVGKRVRISVQLIHAATDNHIWAENYDRDFKDILLTQSEVARTIAKKIKVKLTQHENKHLMRIRPINPESYDAYLKGRFHWYKLSPQNYQLALEYFSLALEKDPEYALANAGIAMVLFAKVYWGITPPRESMPEAKSLVLKTLKMDNNLEEAHDVLARILYFYDWDWEGAERAFKYAIQLNPNKADVHLFYSSFLRSMGRGDEAGSEAELGLELDPLNSFSQCHYIGHLLYLHRYDDSIRRLRKILSLESDSPFALRYLWICYHQKKEYDQAIEAAKNYFSAMGICEYTETIDRSYTNSDYNGAMNMLAQKFEEHLKKSYIQPVWIARLYAYARDKARALDWLEKAYEQRDLLMTNLTASSDWDNLCEEERFKALVKRMNFPEKK